MEAIIVTNGSVEEIAALVVAVQERQKMETTRDLAQEIQRQSDHLRDQIESSQPSQ